MLGPQARPRAPRAGVHEMDGLAATKQIVSDGGPRVLILTTFELDEYVYEAMRVGASFGPPIARESSLCATPCRPMA